MTHPNDLYTTSAPALEMKADDQGRIEGWASIFGGEPDYHGDVVAPGAFTASLTRRKAAGDLPVMLWAHQLEEPIGRWIDFVEEPKGLLVRGAINLKTTRGRDAFEHVRAKDADGLSIGYRTAEGGRRYAGKGAFELTEVDLFEVSVVALPAHPRARITAHKMIGSRAEAEAMLREAGLPRKAAERFAAGGWKALAGDDRGEKVLDLVRRLDGALEQMRR